jgi:hypothetical protein
MADATYITVAADSVARFLIDAFGVPIREEASGSER